MKLQRIGIANSTMLALSFLRDSYLVSQEAAGCTAKTLTNIKTAFKVFMAFAKDQGISTVDQIDANTMRAFILAERIRGQQDRSVQAYLIIMQAFNVWIIEPPRCINSSVKALASRDHQRPKQMTPNSEAESIASEFGPSRFRLSF